MTSARRNEEETHESNQSLWLLTLSPTIFAAYFLACYITAAVWCAKIGAAGEPLTIVRMAIAVYTIAALIGMALVGWNGYRRHRFGMATVPHDFDTPEDRHRFLGFAILLLSGLSVVATIYVVLAAVFIGDCR